MSAPLLQPQNLEAEESVLGAMMVSASALDPVIVDARLRGEDFYRERHREIFGAIASLYDRGAAVDALTVSEDLAARGVLEKVGGRAAVSSLASTTPVPGNAAHYAEIVRDTALLRRSLTFSQRLSQQILSREVGPDEIRELLEQETIALFDDDGSELTTVTDVVEAAVARMEKRMSGDVVEGLSCGFVDLDEKLGRLQHGRLIVLAARPSVGKTALAIAMAQHTAIRQKKPTVLFSLEMSDEELGDRILVSRAMLDNQRFRRGTDLRGSDLKKVLRAANEVQGSPLFIDQRPHTLGEIRSISRQLHAKSSEQGGLGLIVVDYLQLIQSPPGRRDANRTLEVSEIARGLKHLASELGVPVLALSQLNRKAEDRPDGRPRLADLRETGEIENAADQVVLLWREDMQTETPERPGECEANVAKNRHGPTGVVRLAFVDHQSRFANLARSAS